MKKVLLKVFSANFLQLISSLLVGFVVPSILNIEDYANLKTYTLLISYIGFFHLGFIDGIYLKYGGKKYDELKQSEVLGEHNTLIFIEIAITAIIIIISILLKNIIVFLFAISIIPYVISSFFKYLYQSTGEFSRFTRIVYIYSITYLLMNIILAIALKNTNYIYYCMVTIIANILSSVVFEFKFLYDLRTIKPIYNFNSIKKILKTGFILMIGNFIVVLIFGIDKWFIKLFFSVEDFAYYSFAVSMLNIILTLVSAISITFYNYLFSNGSKENINKIKSGLYVLGAFSSVGYFVLNTILCLFLKKYIPSLSVISITFAIFPYLLVINSLNNNLYKVYKKEKNYLRVVVISLIISTVYNIIATLLFKRIESIAFASLLTIITWFLYSSHDIKVITISVKDLLYLSISTVSFLLLSNCVNNYIGLLTYSFIILILSLVFFKKDLLSLVSKGD